MNWLIQAAIGGLIVTMAVRLLVWLIQRVIAELRR